MIRGHIRLYNGKRRNTKYTSGFFKSPLDKSILLNLQGEKIYVFIYII